MPNAASLARFPQAVAVLRRISHARFCSCFCCAADLVAAEDEAERVRADSEEEALTEADVDFNRQRKVA